MFTHLFLDSMTNNTYEAAAQPVLSVREEQTTPVLTTQSGADEE